MTCKRGSFALSEALKHVFISKTRISSRSTNRLLHQIPSGNISTPSTVRHRLAPVNPKTFGPTDYITKIKDEDIPSSIICLRDDRGKLGQPQSKLDVLKSLDRKGFFLVQISKDDSNIPVCRIIPRATLYAQEKASNKTKRKPSNDKKEIEIPWKAAEGDIDRKLRVASDILEKGKKVSVEIIARRPRDIIRDKREAQAIVDQIRRKITSMEGIKEIADEGGVMGKVITIHLEPLVKQRQENKTPERNAKAIEIAWTVTDDEIQTKKWRIEQLLASGVPVDLAVNSRRKAFEIPEKDGNEVLTRVWAILGQIPEIREVKPRSGTPGKMVTLYLDTELA